MKKISMAACLLAFVGFASGCGGNSDSTATNADTSSTTTTTSPDTSSMASMPAETKDTSMEKDRKFVLEAGSGGMMEVELGKLAATNASSAKVKEFGKMMVTDHTKANAELKAIAATKNVTIPPTLMEEHQKHVTDLKAKKGADFDKAYVDLMVDDHEEDVSNFQKEASDGNDAAVKAFATKTLPVLQSHLSHIKTIKDGMK